MEGNLEEEECAGPVELEVPNTDDPPPNPLMAPVPSPDPELAEDTVPNPDEPVPNPEEPVPNPDEPIPNPEEVETTPDEPVLNPVLNPDEPVPNPADPVPNPDEPVPTCADPVPNPDKPVSNPAPNPDESIPNPEDPIPNPEEPVPNPDPVPIPDEPVPTPDDAVPNPEEPVPNPIIPPPPNPVETPPVPEADLSLAEGLLAVPNTELAGLKTEPPTVEGLPNIDPNTVPVLADPVLDPVVSAPKPEGAPPKAGTLELPEPKPTFWLPVPNPGVELETDVLNPCVEELDLNPDPDIPKAPGVLLNPVIPVPVPLEPNPGADPRPTALEVLELKPVLLKPVEVPKPGLALAVFPDPKT